MRLRARALATRTVEVEDVRDTDAVVTSIAGHYACRPQAVLTTLGTCAQAAADLGATLGARGTDPAAVRKARDKSLCRDALREAGIASIDHAVVVDLHEAITAATAIGYPVIVKPVLGIGKTTTEIVHTQASLSTFFETLPGERAALREGLAAHLDERLMIEKVAVGDLYSVEIANSGGGCIPLVAVARKTGVDNPVLELGCTVPSGLEPHLEQELRSYACRVCTTLGLDIGIFHVEVMHTAAGFRLIEVNPRITGGALPETINAVADINVFDLLVDLYLGTTGPLQPLSITGYGSHSFLAAAQPSVVPAYLPNDWFNIYRAMIHSGYCHAQPGMGVPAMKGNFDSFGMVRVIDPVLTIAEERCAHIKAEVEATLGFRLVPELTGDSRRTALAR